MAFVFDINYYGFERVFKNHIAGNSCTAGDICLHTWCFCWCASIVTLTHDKPAGQVSRLSWMDMMNHYVACLCLMSDFLRSISISASVTDGSGSRTPPLLSNDQSVSQASVAGADEMRVNPG